MAPPRRTYERFRRDAAANMSTHLQIIPEANHSWVWYAWEAKDAGLDEDDTPWRGEGYYLVEQAHGDNPGGVLFIGTKAATAWKRPRRLVATYRREERKARRRLNPPPSFQEVFGVICQSVGLGVSVVNAVGALR